MKIFITLLIGVLVLAHVPKVFAQEFSEKQKIERLIKLVEEFDGEFERNGIKYSAKKAADHLRMKLSKYEKSKPSEYVISVSEFIDKLASRSSFSDKPYFLIDKNGIRFEAKDWLRIRVKE